MLTLLRHGIVPGEDRHLLFRVPNPWLEQDEEKISRILAAVARANLLFLLACDRLGVAPARNAIHEVTIPQVNANADVTAMVKIGSLYRQALAGLLGDEPDRADRFLSRARGAGAPGRAPGTGRAGQAGAAVENVGALAHLPELLEACYRGAGAEHRPRRPPDAGELRDPLRRRRSAGAGIPRDV